MMPVSISRFPPSWYIGKQFMALAPSPTLLSDSRHNNLSYEAYLERYTSETLSKLDVETVYNNILIAAGGKEPVLLCFEDLTKPGEWCHRRIVSGWFFKELGVTVPEFIITPKHTSKPKLIF